MAFPLFPLHSHLKHKQVRRHTAQKCGIKSRRNRTKNAQILQPRLNFKVRPTSGRGATWAGIPRHPPLCGGGVEHGQRCLHATVEHAHTSKAFPAPKVLEVQKSPFLGIFGPNFLALKHQCPTLAVPLFKWGVSLPLLYVGSGQGEPPAPRSNPTAGGGGGPALGPGADAPHAGVCVRVPRGAAAGGPRPVPGRDGPPAAEAVCVHGQAYGAVFVRSFEVGAEGQAATLWVTHCSKVLWRATAASATRPDCHTRPWRQSSPSATYLRRRRRRSRPSSPAHRGK